MMNIKSDFPSDIKIIYHEGNSTIKLFPADFPKTSVLNEALNLARVEETGLHISKLREVTKIDDRWAIITDKIDGDTLSVLIAEHPEKREEYLDLFVKVQMEIHTKRSPLLTKLKDKMNNKIMFAELDATTRYDLHTRLEGMPKHNKVCHGDFNPSKVIIAKDGTPYVIDWSHVTQGNASADIARTYLVFKLNGEDEFAELYLNSFCEKSNTPRKYVEKWLPVVAASQSVKGKPEERAFLLDWINVVDYE